MQKTKHIKMKQVSIWLTPAMLDELERQAETLGLKPLTYARSLLVQRLREETERAAHKEVR